LSQQAKKTLKIESNELKEKLEDLLCDIDLELWNEESKIPPDYLITNQTDPVFDSQTKVILLAAIALPVSKIDKNIIAVLDPGLLKHNVGQTYLKRLLGANSSVALEVQFETDGVGFKNFRLIDPDSQGHYSDMIAREIMKTNIHPVVPRMFFDGAISYLYELHEKNQVNFPVEVDYGAFKDCFVIQMHCSLESLRHHELISSFQSYDPLNPMKGLLSLITAQVDVLDIYTLVSTSKLVMTGVWFNADFKSKIGLCTSLLIHDIEKFEPSSYEFKPEQIDLSINADQSVESQLIQKIEALNASEIEKFLVKGGDGNEQEENTLVKGLALTEDELIKISGKFEEDESFIRIKGGEQATPEEVLRFKKAVLIDEIKEKVVAQGRLDSDKFKQVIKDRLGVQDELANKLLEDTGSPQANKSWSPKVESKGKDHEILLRDAQIHKMKKLIDRMKSEILLLKEENCDSINPILAYQKDKINDYKDNKIAALAKRNEDLVEEKNSLSIGNTDRSAMAELESENDALNSQLEVLNQRLSQMNENIDVRIKQGQEKLLREIEALKRQNKIAHDVMQKFKSEKQQLELSYKATKDELALAHEKIIEIGNNGSVDNQMGIEIKRVQEFLKQEQVRSRALEAELKNAQVEVKKHEQKTKFLQAQLENLQKQATSQVQTRATGARNGADKPSGREAQLQRLVETMKANEEKVSSELIGKKDELNKLKSESTLLQNKLNEAIRKLSKYEKKAA
jgi:hypothetical protein